MSEAARADSDSGPTIDPLLLATVRIDTFVDTRRLTGASGFFFRRDQRLFLVSSRHVFIDPESGHHPNRLELELHADARNFADSIGLSVPLYRDGWANWRQGQDEAGGIDVAVIEIERNALPPAVALAAFTPQSLPRTGQEIPIGQAILIPGFPLGFHDGLHHFPVVRQGTVASPYGWRFQGMAWFLTDARTHRGISGAPVVVRALDRPTLPWMLVGVHSSRFDMGNRDLAADESLGLNAAWYPEIVLTLTEPSGPPEAQALPVSRASPPCR